MPADIGLVGFNNEPVVSLVTPGISSVDQPAFELGKTAAKLFIERMHNEEMDDVEVILKPRLVIRESSRRRGDPAEWHLVQCGY
jgi:DNA-binding LacI/PurR family transcriptional regulator